VTTAQVRETPCTLQSRAVGEHQAGTAPTARAWIVVEHDGPWGRQAVAESDLPEPVKANLAGAKDRQITVLLARRPGRRTPRTGGHRVWVARGAAGGARLRSGIVADLGVLATWDLAAIADGTLPALDHVDAEPLLLVCTNGRRDACCAVNGRALLAGLAEQAPREQFDRVWECSHVGGHRFAPVVLTLPDAMVHGRVSLADGLALLAGLPQGLVRPDVLRGRSCLPPPLQAAEIAVRRVAGADRADDLDVLAHVGERVVPVPPNWPAPASTVTTQVRHRDGRAWTVAVSANDPETASVVRAESCGGAALPVHSWRADPPIATTPWR